MPDRRGFTLTELIISAGLFALLAVIITVVLRTILISWDLQEKRSAIDINLDRGIEEMVRDLRRSKQIQSAANYDEIRFCQGTTTTSCYIFYLYNVSDSYGPPPAFNQSSYQLKRAALTGDLNGTFTYGSGDVVVTDVLPPPTSDLSLSSNLLTIDLSAKRGDETIHSRTQVRPRNV
ncbi:MAG: prepilin-type N-terminal cleavage/methylation domain-containing protein [Candidatus Omnitrophica bacterium]|nr:prepilin-type N-terminal cleavage/methylation domain-containing protein [Candidatus Omnitrophota bacterium]